MGIVETQRRNTQLTGEDSQRKQYLGWLSKELQKLPSKEGKGIPGHAHSTGKGRGTEMCFWAQGTLCSGNACDRVIGGSQACRATELGFARPVPASCCFTHCEHQNASFSLPPSASYEGSGTCLTFPVSHSWPGPVSHSLSCLRKPLLQKTLNQISLWNPVLSPLHGCSF